jgi:hypothetical protein
MTRRRDSLTSFILNSRIQVVRTVFIPVGMLASKTAIDFCASQIFRIAEPQFTTFFARVGLVGWPCCCTSSNAASSRCCFCARNFDICIVTPRNLTGCSSAHGRRRGSTKWMRIRRPWTASLSNSPFLWLLMPDRAREGCADSGCTTV